MRTQARERTSVSSSGEVAATPPKAGTLAVALCIPQILSTGVLAILGAVPESGYSNLAIRLLSVIALPAFMVAAYAGPVFLVIARLAVAGALVQHSRVQVAIGVAALVLGILSFVFFQRVVVWWDLPLP